MGEGHAGASAGRTPFGRIEAVATPSRNAEVGVVAATPSRDAPPRGDYEEAVAAMAATDSSRIWRLSGTPVYRNMAAPFASAVRGAQRLGIYKLGLAVFTIAVVILVFSFGAGAKCTKFGAACLSVSIYPNAIMVNMQNLAPYSITITSLGCVVNGTTWARVPLNLTMSPSNTSVYLMQCPNKASLQNPQALQKVSLTFTYLNGQGGQQYIYTVPLLSLYRQSLGEVITTVTITKAEATAETTTEPTTSELSTLPGLTTSPSTETTTSTTTSETTVAGGGGGGGGGQPPASTTIAPTTTVPGNISASGKWVSAYYAGWLDSPAWLDPSVVNYSAVTLIIHFAVNPYSNGSLWLSNGFTDNGMINRTVQAAHANGKMIIISVGGSYTGPAFDNATSPANLTLFVRNIVDFMTVHGYDGVDLDIEPIENGTRFQQFVAALYAAMQAASQGSILTIAMGPDEAPIIAPVQQYFSQINLMTYGMGGNWGGWVTWYNSPVYTGGCIFTSTLQPVPSIQQYVNETEAAGIPASKIGIGIEFYGAVWTGGAGVAPPPQDILDELTGSVGDLAKGVSGPCESWNYSSWSNYPSVRFDVPVYNITQAYSGYPVQWDSGAKESYISVTDGPLNKFISYDDAQAIQAKAQFVQQGGLGGVIIFELAGAYNPSLPVDQRQALLAAVGRSFCGSACPNTYPGGT